MIFLSKYSFLIEICLVISYNRCTCFKCECVNLIFILFMFYGVTGERNKVRPLGRKSNKTPKIINRDIYGRVRTRWPHPLLGYMPIPTAYRHFTLLSLHPSVCFFLSTVEPVYIEHSREMKKCSMYAGVQCIQVLSIWRSGEIQTKLRVIRETWSFHCKM